MLKKLLLGRPVHQVVADHFVGAFGGATSCPEADQHAGDDRAIDLNLDPLRIRAQEVTATK